MRRNINIKLFVHDNQIYGLTKGQPSPTTGEGMVTKNMPFGVVSGQFNPLALAVALDCSFAARSFSGDPEHLKQMMKEAIEMLRPRMQAEGATSSGKIVFGTVKGDLHDIGKNIVISMLSVAGFEIADLGVDVPSERFVSEVKEKKPDIVCMSSLLTHTMPELKIVIDELMKNGMRSRVKVMVGGRPLTQEYADSIGADSYGRDAYEAVTKAKELMKR